MKIISTDNLISQKYKKCSPEKYALLLYIEVSIRFDFQLAYFRIFVTISSLLIFKKPIVKIISPKWTVKEDLKNLICTNFHRKTF